MNQLLFGRDPTAVVLQTTNNFDGSTPVTLGTATIAEGIATFPAMSGGGLYNFNADPILVQAIDFYGAGNLSIYKVNGAVSTLIGQLGGATNTFTQGILLMPGQALSFISTGTSGNKSVAITAALTLEASAGGGGGLPGATGPAGPGGQASGVVKIISGSTYQVLATDVGGTLAFTNTCVVTMADATIAPFWSSSTSKGSDITLKNIGAGVVTAQGFNSGQKIDGQTSIQITSTPYTNQSQTLIANGAGWYLK
jgi:hypothetical protein